MSAYIIALIDIHDRDEYKKYQEGFREVFSQYQTLAQHRFRAAKTNLILAKGWS